jgi:hypothetical protein
MTTPVRVLARWLLLWVGALCAIAVACGGASPKYAAAPPSTREASPSMPGPADARAQIDGLSREIDDDLAALGLSRPAAPFTACVQPPCGAEALGAGLRPAHSAEPACRPGGAELCHDSCRLSDSICESSGRICRIASDLGGGDAYANEKCAGGKASCDAARAKCCGCQ